MQSLTPPQFVQNWQNTTLKERQSYQIHFLELCDLIGHERPSGSGIDRAGKTFAFEYGVKKDVGGQGFADVFYEGHFAIEYKAAGKYKDLTEAYQQLLQYRERLNNPPLLIVTDIATWEIHTNFPNTEKKVFSFTNAEIASRPSVFKMLQAIFEAPERLHPDRNTEQVTTDAAGVFRVIAEDMRRELDASPDRIAHFLTKLVFCLFAEDVSLLPNALNSAKGIFADIVERTYREPSRFVRYAEELFKAMASGGEVMFQKIPYFNGSLFDDVQVEQVSTEALGKLLAAAALNWESVEPAIFGTLFERSLDPSKRAQLGAHYTSREDILLIVEPVLMQPLRREWDALQAKAAPVRAQLDSATTPKDRIKYTRELESLRETILHRLREIKVLDPACGSGNFLYVSLQLLMDLEKEVITHPLFAGLTLAMPEVHPRQMYGIEINPIAHDLATIVVWIGYIQWRQSNGYARAFSEPILESLQGNIQQMDAIMNADGSEPEWPAVDVIVGNPPFLGGQRMRRELGYSYVDQIFTLYQDRVLPGSDLVCYWFEKARTHISSGKVKRTGLLATQAIRSGVSRHVLNRIKNSGDIFMAWADRPWILDGAAVRVSMVGFDNGDEKEKMLDGHVALMIASNLKADIDLTVAKPLIENLNIVARGIETGGPFELEADEALKLRSNLLNHPIIVPIINARDITGEPLNLSLIDFDQTPDISPESYPDVYKFLRTKWDLALQSSRAPVARDQWWRFRRSGEKVRSIINSGNRYICTPRVAKHRIFVWAAPNAIIDSRIFAIARDDDYFFGVLHSNIHEVWSLATSSRHGDGNDGGRPTYNAESCFETFPFPWSPAHEDTASPAYQAVAAAAKQLHEERQAWLDVGSKDRTLTNLYNALNVLKGVETIKVKPDAAAFAPRLLELHTTLDRAVCDAYGWPHDILSNDDEILRRLLELNLQRATS